MKNDVLAQHASGTPTKWDPLGCTANWQCVDEAGPYNMTAYFSETSHLESDEYAMQDLQGSPAIASVT